MSFLKQHRTQIIILFSATLFFALLMVITFWNNSDRPNLSISPWPFIYLILAIACFTVAVLLFHKEFNSAVIEELIQENVKNERTRLLAEFEKKDEEVINKEENVDEIAARIVPKGKFKSAAAFGEKLLKSLSDELQASLGVLYLAKGKKYSFLAGFALSGEVPPDFEEGENLNGQVAASKELMVVENIPENYFSIESGLGKSKPKTLIIAPVLQKNTAIAILEIATFIESADQLVKILTKVATLAAEKIVQIEKS